jgi:hypothetical protein
MGLWTAPMVAEMANATNSATVAVTKGERGYGSEAAPQKALRLIECPKKLHLGVH